MHPTHTSLWGRSRSFSSKTSAFSHPTLLSQGCTPRALHAPHQVHEAQRVRSTQTEQPSTSGGERAATLGGHAIRQATRAAELRAAAYLRAYSFYTYPEDRNPMAARAHRRMKGDSEWESVTAKVAGTETNYKHMKVTCFITTVNDDPESEVAVQVSHDMDRSTKLPADPAAGRPLPQLVIGSLDLNVGAVLPAEELVGRRPAENASTSRAYLSNVCVATAVRRQGVAQALVERAQAEAAAADIKYLYVHVVHDNLAAVRLYQQSLGFEVEAEESAGVARTLQRPKRLLLVKRV